MRHSVIVKFFTIFLASFSLLAAITGSAGIVEMENAGLYINGLDELQDQKCMDIAAEIAREYAACFAADTFGNLNYTLRQELIDDPAERGDASHWVVKLKQGETVLVDPGDVSDYSMSWEYTIIPHYPIASRNRPSDEDPEPETTEPVTQPAPGMPRASNPQSFEDVEPPSDYLYYETHNRWGAGSFDTIYLYYCKAPEYTVTVYLQQEVLKSSSIHILTEMYPHRYGFIAILALGLLLFACCMVYLLWSAGVTSDGTVHPNGLNRMPLDLYALLLGIGITALAALFSSVRQWIDHEGPHMGNLSLLAINLLGIILLGIAFPIAVAAQVKVKESFWWYHSVIGWSLSKLFKGIRFLLRGLAKVFGMLPVIWQWLLTAIMMIATLGASCVIAEVSAKANGVGAMIGVLQLPAMLLICVGLTLYGGYAFGNLLVGARKMAQGDLEHKIPTTYLVGSFRECAQQLNSLSDTAMKEAQNRLRSERMKTELITNVSHDIKTPLTSIINFVDLLQKPHTEAEEVQYLEVLSRQSGRMKRLIQDLIDLSKASTGNMSVSMEQLDLAEAMQQALGEFADKLDSALLTPVFRHPEAPVWVLADGRLLWRVLSNLLSNAVKYAMPSTRLYIDLQQKDDLVLLSLKNISREELNTSAEELMERFVQGDESRNKEGSGLGLNIAQSLMELQQGTMQIQLDGDLFKVTLTFRATQ